MGRVQLYIFLRQGFCRLTPHPRSPGNWTIYFEGADYESHLLQDNADLASSPLVDFVGKIIKHYLI